MDTFFPAAPFSGDQYTPEAVEGGHGQWLGLGGCGGDGLRKTNGAKRRDPNCNEIGPYPQNRMASCFVDHLFHPIYIPTSSM
jgi:hypothetical protein